jgi:wyosine [tRNA(Phe)-imidazoG37] synthetase (radical SAM superfamily)
VGGATVAITTTTDHELEAQRKEGWENMIAFGPVPSRRLGRSLGVNNIPPKCCSYSCIYCQVGPTLRREIVRCAFQRPDDVVDAVKQKVEGCKMVGEAIDHITFVPDGEPTLDVNLGEEIRALKPLGIPLAVITNGSLLWDPEVEAGLAAADRVSVKVDGTEPGLWRRVNRPHGKLDLDVILDGILDFASAYGGDLLSETMLVGGFNDDVASVEGVAAFLERLRPRCAYLAVPTRPPASSRARPPDDEAVVRAYRTMAEKLASVELLVMGEEGPFGRTGDPARDLLATLAVHPMREAAVERYLAESGAGQERVRELLRRGIVAKVEYQGELFYVRRFSISH